MNILNECAIDNDIVKPPKKKTGLGFFKCFFWGFYWVFFFGVGFFNASPDCRDLHSLNTSGMHRRPIEGLHLVDNYLVFQYI